MLRGHEGLDVVGTALSVAEGRAVCGQQRPDVLILDLALPDGRGLEVAEALQEVAPSARVIVLSGEASSFVCPSHLQPMLHAVVDKTRAYGTLSLEIAEIVRQRRAEACVAGGWTGVCTGETSSREIAAQLHLSQRTVETHRKNIVAKLGVSGSELVRMAALQLTPRAGGLDLPAPPER